VNLSYAAAAEDPRLAYTVAREGYELATKLGMRGYGFYLLGNAADMAIRIGDWDWALREIEAWLAEDDEMGPARVRRAQIQGFRGEDVEAEFEAAAESVADMTELQARAGVDEARAMVALGRGEPQRALELAQRSYRLNIAPDGTALQTASRAAAWLGDVASLREALGTFEEQPGRVPAAARRESAGALAALEGRTSEAQAAFADALHRWREIGVDFEAAMCALNLVTMLGPADPEARAAAESAAAVFERLGAKPLQDLLAAALSARRPAPPPAVHRAAMPAASPERG
jgi:hypothetical protein